MRLLSNLMKQYSSTANKSYEELVDALEPVKKNHPLEFKEREIRLLTRPFFEALRPDMIAGDKLAKQKAKNKNDYQDRMNILDKLHLPDEGHEYIDEKFDKANKMVKKNLNAESNLIKRMHLHSVDKKTAAKLFYEHRRMMYKLSLHLDAHEHDRIDPIHDLVVFLYTTDRVGIIEKDGEKKLGYTSLPVDEVLRAKMIDQYEKLVPKLSKVFCFRTNRFIEMPDGVLTAI